MPGTDVRHQRDEHFRLIGLKYLHARFLFWRLNKAIVKKLPFTSAPNAVEHSFSSMTRPLIEILLIPRYYGHHAKNLFAAFRPDADPTRDRLFTRSKLIFLGLGTCSVTIGTSRTITASRSANSLSSPIASERRL